MTKTATAPKITNAHIAQVPDSYRSRVTAPVMNTVLDAIDSSNEPLTVDEVVERIRKMTGRTFHRTSIYHALRALTGIQYVVSREETLAEREARTGEVDAPGRLSYLYFKMTSSAKVPKRTRRQTSRPAISKKVQTGTSTKTSRPAISTPVQTGVGETLIKLQKRVNELEAQNTVLMKMLDRLLTN